MKSGEETARELLDSLETSLDLLRDYAEVPGAAPFDAERAETVPTLLEQCATLVAEIPLETPVRSVHHLACTGGTLICKAIALMPNVTLLSEIDPLSHLGLPPRSATPSFRPSDIIFAGRMALRPIDDAVAGRVALAALDEMQRALAEEGRVLCLRDHAHSQYCTRRDPSARPSLYAMLRGNAPLRAVVTVRHPLDAFLSLRQNAWVHFQPDTLEEYARRYILFLEDHADLAMFRYEDFVAAPETELERICAALGLAYVPGMEALLPAVRMSGDSGRKSSRRIAPRPRRAVPAVLAEEAKTSAAYRDLCARLEYDV